MKSVQAPKDNFYVVPRDFPADKMHYGVVQISKHRHIVVEYTGVTTNLYGSNPSFVVVSEALRYDDAAALALEYTNNRLDRRDGIEVKDADRTIYHQYNDAEIRTVQIIQKLPDPTLLALRAEFQSNAKYPSPGPVFQRLQLRVGKNIPEKWLLQRVAQQLFQRSMITPQEYDAYTGA